MYLNYSQVSFFKSKVNETLIFTAAPSKPPCVSRPTGGSAEAAHSDGGGWGHRSTTMAVSTKRRTSSTAKRVPDKRSLRKPAEDLCCRVVLCCGAWGEFTEAVSCSHGPERCCRGRQLIKMSDKLLAKEQQQQQRRRGGEDRTNNRLSARRRELEESWAEETG